MDLSVRTVPATESIRLTRMLRMDLVQLRRLSVDELRPDGGAPRVLAVLIACAPKRALQPAGSIPQYVRAVSSSYYKGKSRRVLNPETKS